MFGIMILNFVLVIAASVVAKRYTFLVKYIQFIMYFSYTATWLAAVWYFLPGEYTDSFSYPNRIYCMMIYSVGAMINWHNYTVMFIVRSSWTATMYILAKQFVIEPPDQDINWSFVFNQILSILPMFAILETIFYTTKNFAIEMFCNSHFATMTAEQTNKILSALPEAIVIFDENFELKFKNANLMKFLIPSQIRNWQQTIESRLFFETSDRLETFGTNSNNFETSDYSYSFKEIVRNEFIKHGNFKMKIFQ